MGTRAAGLTADDVDRARERDRSIVLTWAMRGTLHLIASEDHSWLLPLVLEPRLATAHRRLRQEGVPPDRWDGAVAAMERMLDAEGPLTRPEIADRLERKGIRTAGQAIAHLVWLAAARGVLCVGPGSHREQRFVLVRDWLARSTTRGGPGDPLAELGLRYLRSHGPATPTDLAFWSGMRLGDANKAWAAIGSRLIEVDSARGSAWRLRTTSRPAPPGQVRLLPAFDEYLLGWRDRDLLASSAQWRAINRGGGWLHPVVLAEGRAAGTWRSEQGSGGGVRLTVRPFGTLRPPVRRGVDAEAKRVAAFLGRRVEALTVERP